MNAMSRPIRAAHLRGLYPQLAGIGGVNARVR
jgi:hypothetical protein